MAAKLIKEMNKQAVADKNASIFMLADPAIALRLAADMLPAMEFKKKSLLKIQAAEAEAKKLVNNPGQKLTLVNNSLCLRLNLQHRGSEVVKFLPEPPCEVRPSKIHGHGVFALQDIPAFTYLTMYPCDGFAFTSMDGEAFMGWFGATPKDDVSYRQNFRIKGLTNLTTLNSLHITGNPQLKDDPHFIGHMINDGATCRRRETMAIYEDMSVMKANAVFDPFLNALFSYKIIRAGEEVLLSYGLEYWMHVLNVESLSWTDCGFPEMETSDDSDDEIILVKGPILSQMD